MLLSIISAQSQDSGQVDAQPNEIAPSILPECPVCRITFRRMQERNRHIEAHLPNSIHCPVHRCVWTGRRQSDFRAHWKKKHSESGQVLAEDAIEIYDPKGFVKTILDGTPVDEVARSAFSKVQERLVELGKLDANVLSDSVVPIQPRDSNQVDAEPNEAVSSILPECPVCSMAFRRVQERNRHIESHLPNSIHCPLHRCVWTGRRQSDFKEHWRKKHSESGQVLAEDAIEIYDPKGFVKMTLDGTPVDEVARSAFSKVQESLGKLVEAGDLDTNVLSVSVAPTQSQDSDQADAEPNEAVPSVLPECPVCSMAFRRVQERNRHIESHLPNSIHCPVHSCVWTGHRQSDFREHWKKKHSKSG